MSVNSMTKTPLPQYPVFKLTPEEIEDPYLMLQDLYTYFHLPQLRQELWNAFKATVIGNFPKGLTREERKDIINLYEYLDRLAEAAHLLNRQYTMGKTGRKGNSPG